MVNRAEAVPISRQMLPAEGRLQAQHKQNETVNLQYMYSLKARWYMTAQYQSLRTDTCKQQKAGYAGQCLMEQKQLEVKRLQQDLDQ